MTRQDSPSPGFRLSRVLAELDVPPEVDLHLGEVIDRTHHAGFGDLCAFLALRAIPPIGVSVPFGIAIAVLGSQMLTGRATPWLPAFLRRRRVPPRGLRWLAERLARWTSRLERLIRPRYPGLIHPGLIGMALMFQGLGLALPLPIPGSNWLFIVPILVYAFGLLEDDGLLCLAGHLLTAILLVSAFFSAHFARDAITSVLHWFH
jgi:hypothetical protein